MTHEEQLEQLRESWRMAGATPLELALMEEITARHERSYFDETRCLRSCVACAITVAVCARAGVAPAYLAAKG